VNVIQKEEEKTQQPPPPPTVQPNTPAPHANERGEFFFAQEF
jgi:hypothetical protein